MKDSFLTISKSSEGLYKEKGSKFMAFAFPVISEEEIKEKLTLLRKEYYDARHHCYAYTYGNEGQHVRANDDGEPNHSAGDPILGQIRSKALTNTLIVVIRYFGGTKLGVSGLINAYKTAAAEAIESNSIIKKNITSNFKFSFSYDEMNEVMKLVKDLDLKVKNQGFDNGCTLDVEVITSAVESLKTKVQFLVDTGHKIKLK